MTGEHDLSFKIRELEIEKCDQFGVNLPDPTNSKQLKAHGIIELLVLDPTNSNNFVADSLEVTRDGKLYTSAGEINHIWISFNFMGFFFVCISGLPDAIDPNWDLVNGRLSLGLG